MKKIIAFVLTMFMLILLVACNNSPTSGDNNGNKDNVNNDSITTPSDSSNDTETTEQTTPADGSDGGSSTILESDPSDFEYISLENSADGTVSYAITGYKGNATNIAIPNTYNGEPVTEIMLFDLHAFENCKEIFIPQNISQINALFYKSNLEKLTVSEDNSVFYSRDNCVVHKETKKLVLGCSHSTIPNDNDVTTIGAYAFAYCSGPKDLTLPDNIEYVEEYAFFNCIEIKNLSIGKKARLAPFVFNGCASIETIAVSTENPYYTSEANCLLDKIDKTLKLGCKNSIIPVNNGVTQIGSSAFSGAGIVEFVIPQGITTLSSQAFEDCVALVSITIPSSVESISTNAFRRCENLVHINYQGTKEQWESLSKGRDWDYKTGEYTVHCIDGDITK